MGVPHLSALLLLCLTAQMHQCTAYYLPGTYPQEFSRGDQLQAEVNSLTSDETELPFDYYSLPFCQPPEGKKKALSTVNPGTILLGAHIENSPYNFTMLEVEKGKVVCNEEKRKGSYGELSKREAKMLQDMVEQQYRVRLILDNLPITTLDLTKNPDSVRPGFDLGFEDGKRFYINNHLIFNILYHITDGRYTKAQESIEQLEAAAIVEGGARRLLADEKAAGQPPAAGTPPTVKYMVVGFEVIACSIARTPGKPIADIQCPNPEDAEKPKPQIIEKGANIVYTYDVFWQASDVTWASRWDAYLRMPGGRVHWFSIMNSIMVVVVMSCIVAMIMMRTIRRDLARYESLLVESGPKDDLEESGWKMVSGDVFRPPKDALLLCVQLGSGLQILSSSFITLLFAALGFLSPASRGALLTALLVMYLLLAVAAGFGAVYLWGIINRSYEGWYGVCWRVACYFPGIALGMLSVLNVLIHHTGSSGAIPLGAFFSLISLWFIISIPLCYSGGMIAAKQEIKQYPTRTNQIPRHIPPPHWASHPHMLFLAAGLLPFGTIFVELYFAMTSIWQGYFYYIFGFLFIVGILTVIITIEVSVVCTYVQLCAEDYLWWWRSFYRGGSIAFYVMLYGLGFLVNTLHNLATFLSAVLYLSYMGLAVWGIYLAMGTVGFVSSFYFTYKIFDSVKAD